MTKMSLVSGVAKTFDALGWYSLTIVKAKILLQALWFEGIGWDDCVPMLSWKNGLSGDGSLSVLSTHYIAWCYYPKATVIVSTQLRGFSDASEKAYSGVIYLRMEDSNGMIYTSFMTSKTLVTPIKRITIPMQARAE